jgi:hypothetical protein
MRGFERIVAQGVQRRAQVRKTNRRLQHIAQRNGRTDFLAYRLRDLGQASLIDPGDPFKQRHAHFAARFGPVREGVACGGDCAIGIFDRAHRQLAGRLFRSRIDDVEKGGAGQRFEPFAADIETVQQSHSVLPCSEVRAVQTGRLPITVARIIWRTAGK